MHVGAGVHLFYCLNLYPVDRYSQLEQAVFAKAANVLEQCGLSDQRAVGLWLRNSLLADFPAEKFNDKLREGKLYCCSLNGFPYGDFHGERIKEQVYLPDWSSSERLEYTKKLARILASLLPKSQMGTISTLPLGYRSALAPERVERAVLNLRSCGEYLKQLYEQTGRKVVLALEPEPDCFLDSSQQAAQWMSEALLGDSADMREYVGVCLDTVHSGVLFETPLESLNSFKKHGVNVFKIQLGGAISLDSAQGRRDVSRYSDEVYLHQVRVRSGDEVQVFNDLPEALTQSPQGEWRVHYHVPLCWQGCGGLRGTGRQVDKEFIAAALSYGVQHFEVEIYTLDVFPDKRLSADEIIVQDLEYVYGLLKDGLKNV